MCRWLAYSGTPILLEELLYKPQYSLIDQSMHSRMGVETTNGDGFGVGWYGVEGASPWLPERSGPELPVIYNGVGPAWGDRNLRELARSTSSGHFLAHIRASTGTPVQQTNCHPFRHEQWLWVHNGAIRGFEVLKRDLVVAVVTFRMGQTHVPRYTKPLLEKSKQAPSNPSFVITHRVPLADAPAAYKTFRDKEDGCIKVVLKP